MSGDGGAAAAVKLESWADVPAEQVTSAEEDELDQLLTHYVRTNHAVPAPNGHTLRDRTGRANGREHASLLQKRYAETRLHDAVVELQALQRRRTALLMLRAVRHCDLHAATPGWRLPDADFFGRAPASRVAPADVSEVIDLTQDEPDYAHIETLVLDGPLAQVWGTLGAACGQLSSAAGLAERASRAVKPEAAEQATPASGARPRAPRGAQQRKRKGDKARGSKPKAARKPWEGDSSGDESDEADDAEPSDEETEEEATLQADAAASVSAAYARIATLPFDEPGKALIPLNFAARYARDAGVADAAEAARNVAEYRRFLAIKAVLGTAVPPPCIDAVYHVHLTFTRSYSRFCDAMGLGFVHHEPCEGTPGNEEALDAAYERTLATYRAAFGAEPPSPPWVPAATANAPMLSVLVPAKELKALRRDARKWRDAHAASNDDGSDGADDAEEEEEPSSESEEPVWKGPPRALYYAKTARKTVAQRKVAPPPPRRMFFCGGPCG